MRVKTKLGREVNLHDDILCALLDAGVVERIVDPVPSKPELTYIPAAVWSARLNNSGHAELFVHCDGCGAKEIFASLGGAAWTWNHCRGHHDAIPAEVRQKFLELESVHA